MKDLEKRITTDMLFLSRLFYFGLHVFSWMLLIIYDNPFRRMVMNYDLMEPIMFTILVLYSNYLLMTAGRNPGYEVN